MIFLTLATLSFFSWKRATDFETLRGETQDKAQAVSFFSRTLAISRYCSRVATTEATRGDLLVEKERNGSDSGIEGRVKKETRQNCFSPTVEVYPSCDETAPVRSVALVYSFYGSIMPGTFFLPILATSMIPS